MPRPMIGRGEYRTPVLGVREVVRAMREPSDKDDFETANRLQVLAALAAFDGEQIAAAKDLRMHPRKLNFYAARYRLRPKDRKAVA